VLAKALELLRIRGPPVEINQAFQRCNNMRQQARLLPVAPSVELLCILHVKVFQKGANG
jgi:hypothetical protein